MEMPEICTHLQFIYDNIPMNPGAKMFFSTITGVIDISDLVTPMSSFSLLCLKHLQ